MKDRGTQANHDVTNSASTAVVVRLPYMRLLASDDFLYDTVDVAIWSSVEQGMAITAGCFATLQPLVKYLGFKLGLRPHASLPSPNGYGNNIRMKEAAIISVKRSFAHRTEPASPGLNMNKYDQGALNLQPGTHGYSAMCYNTSQEHLAAPSTGSGGESSKDLERGISGHGDSERTIPAAYIPSTHATSPRRLSRFHSPDS